MYEKHLVVYIQLYAISTYNTDSEMKSFLQLLGEQKVHKPGYN